MSMKDLEANVKTSGSLPRLNKIRLGTSEQIKKGEKTHKKPINQPHFVLTDAPELQRVYGEKPDELLVYLPFEQLHHNMFGHHELWLNSVTCQCRGDGERVIDMLDRKGVDHVVKKGEVLNAFKTADGEFSPGDVVPCPGKKHSFARCKDCRPSVFLMVMVRDPNDPTQLVGDRMGYYEVHTNSSVNYQTLLERLLYVESLARKVGMTLQGVPMKLVKVQRRMNYIHTDRETGERSRRTGNPWLIDLEPETDWLRRVNMVIAKIAAGEIVENVPMLPMPDLNEEDIIDHEPDADALPDIEQEVNQVPPQEGVLWRSPDQVLEWFANRINQIEGGGDTAFELITEAEASDLAKLWNRALGGIASTEELRHRLGACLIEAPHKVSFKEYTRAEMIAIEEWINTDRAFKQAREEAMAVLEYLATRQPA